VASRSRAPPKQNRLLPSARLSLFRNHRVPTLRKKNRRIYTAETLRDLARKFPRSIRKFFRQQTPRAMLNTAVNEVGPP